MKNPVCRRLHVLPLLLVFLMLTACNSTPDQRAQSGQCPQNRATEYAPASIAALINPLSADENNTRAGEQLYQFAAAPVACMKCHGEDGDGNGVMANMFEPAPRNFTCTEVVGALPDGQLFWIIKNGSIGTSMPAFSKLSDEQIWQLTIYLRTLEIKSAVTNSQSETNQVAPEQTVL